MDECRVHARTHARTHTHTHTHTHNTHTTHTHTRARTYARARTHARAHTHTPCTHTHTMHTHTHHAHTHTLNWPILLLHVQGAKKSSKTADVSTVPLSFINGVGVSSDAMSEDSDVANERRRINNLKGEELTKSDPLVLMNISKVCTACSSWKLELDQHL